MEKGAGDGQVLSDSYSGAPGETRTPNLRILIQSSPVLRSWGGCVCQCVRPPYGGSDISEVPALQNVDVEEALLGAILVNPAVLEDPAVAEVKTDDFAIVRHRWIHEAMVHLAADNRPIDLLTLGG